MIRRSAGRLLDLFCGAGGASYGYWLAGFDVTGVDLAPQPSYRWRFARADALRPPFDLGAFDLIHASPPCQAYSSMRSICLARNGSVPDAPDLVDPIRELLRSSGRPYVIENVPGAPMRADVKLCGSAFGLRVRRHRVFELGGFPGGRPLLLTAPCTCRGYTPVGVFGKRPDGGTLWWKKDRDPSKTQRRAASLAEGAEAMGYAPGEWWGDWKGLKEGIPPQYSEYLGRLLAPLLS